MNDPKKEIRDIYVRAAALYARLAPDLGTNALGYEILYGPVVVAPPILFIGFQPGGEHPEPLPVLPDHSDSDFCRKVFEYGATPPPYPLAQRIQVAFPQSFLGGCTGLNAIFLRAKKQNEYRAKIPAEIRNEFEAFSLCATRRIVEILSPKMVVVLGFSTMELLTPTSNVVLWSDSGKRALVVSASIGGVPALAMPHPTGAIPKPSDEELNKIGAFVLAHVG